MPHDLTEESRAIRDVARTFADEQIAPHALVWDAEKTLPIATLRAAAALGMGGMFVAEDVGGSALSRLDGVLIFEALATGCPVISSFLSIHNMSSWMIDRFGSPELRRALLPALTRMDTIVSYCLSEPGSGSDAAALTTRAIRDGDHYVVTGAKQFISGAGVSDYYLTMVRTGGAGPAGISALVVPRATPGLGFGVNERKMGWNAQPTAAVLFDGARVPVANRLGEEGEGFKLAMRGLDGGRLNIAAAALGAAQSAMEKTLLYMTGRKAFGRSLDQFQALQFRLADMATKIEVSRTFLYRAARALDAGDEQATILSAMAKRYVTDTAYEVVDEALQLHGGYGYLTDYGIEKLVRDLRVHRILEGSNEIMRVIIARSLIGGAAQ